MLNEFETELLKEFNELNKTLKCINENLEDLRGNATDTSMIAYELEQMNNNFNEGD